MWYEAYFLNKETGKETPIVDSTNLRQVLSKLMQIIWGFNVPGHEYKIILMPWKLKAGLVRIGTPFSLAERGSWMMCIQYRHKQ